MTGGRRRARGAGPMPTSCPTSSAARPGRAGPLSGAAAGRSAENGRARAIRCTRRGWKPRLAGGFPVTDDYNGERPEGFGRSQYSIRDGRRSSAATAYLVPARARETFIIATGAQATRLLLRGTHAVGVEYVQNGQVMRAEVAREVILCGGAFNTPQLLMLSGIGPAEHLRGVDITPVVDLPVGRNLQDHLAVFINLARPAAGPYRRAMRADRMGLAMAQAYLFGTGPGTVVPGGLHAFVKTRPDLAVPDG